MGAVGDDFEKQSSSACVFWGTSLISGPALGVDLTRGPRLSRVSIRYKVESLRYEPGPEALLPSYQ
jgi:hypothetical protein